MDKLTRQIKKLEKNKIQPFFNKQSLETLHSLKSYLDDEYYNTGKESSLSDEIYDILKETVISKENKNYIVPIGSKIRNTISEVVLPHYLGSMDKLKTDKELIKWFDEYNNGEYIIQDKLDGVSCLLIISDKMCKMFSRGNGILGADISHLAPYINNIPSLSLQKPLSIRGELVIKKKVFADKYSTLYANTRNMVSGIVNSKTLKEETIDVDFVAYEIINNDGKKSSDQLLYLTNIGFDVANHVIMNIEIEDEKEDILPILSEYLIAFKNNSEYDIDGIIVCSNTKYDRNTSGNPKYSFAYKMVFDDNVIDAEVEKIEWNISKWGILKPTIKIKPVHLNGVKIERATGFNAKFINENNIGKGTIIKLTRSGDVIPFVMKVLKQTKAELPSTGSYTWNDTEVDIISTDDFDDTAKIKTICSFFSDLNIKFVSETTVTKMFNSGLDSLLKILSASKQDLEKIDGFQKRMAERAYDNIHNGLQNISLPLLLGSASVFGYGQGRRKIKKLFEDIPDLLELYKSLGSDELYSKIMEVEGFSDKSATKIIKNLPNAIKFIRSIEPFVSYKTEETKLSDRLQNMKFVLSGFRDSTLEEFIIKESGTVSTSVSKNTTLLIVKDINESSSKIEKANKLGIPIISKEEFISKYL